MIELPQHIKNFIGVLFSPKLSLRVGDVIASGDDAKLLWASYFESQSSLQGPKTAEQSWSGVPFDETKSELSSDATAHTQHIHSDDDSDATAHVLGDRLWEWSESDGFSGE